MPGGHARRRGEGGVGAAGLAVLGEGLADGGADAAEEGLVVDGDQGGGGEAHAGTSMTFP